MKNINVYSRFASRIKKNATGCVTHQRAARFGPIALMLICSVENNMPEVR